MASTTFVWKNVIILAILHLAAFYGIYLKFFRMHTYSRLFFWIYCHVSAFGVTAGRHRYFSHKSFKGNRALDVLMALMTCTAFEQSIFTWVRDHRLHHKHSETDADPYNSNRGFFFCHMGWVFTRKHREVRKHGKSIDMSDMLANPVVMFEYKYCVPLALVFTFIVPLLTPMYFWNEHFHIALFYCTFYRYLLVLHMTWSVNSFAHLYGMRTYDKHIQPAENTIVSTAAFGEGFHNYHHTFPWDYKAAELGSNLRNLTTVFIDLLAFIGLVTERRTAEQNLVDRRKARTGDSTWSAVRRPITDLLMYGLYVVIAT